MLEQAQEEEALVHMLGQFQEKEFLAKIRHTNTNQMKMNINPISEGGGADSAPPW